MQVHLSRKRLLAAVRSLVPVVGTRLYLPILSGIKIEAIGDRVVLEATDLEATARIVLDDVSVEAQGSVIVPAKPLAKALAAMVGDEVTLGSSGEGRTAITSAGRTVTFDGSAIEDWPQIPDGTDAAPITSMPASALADALERTTLCASGDEARVVLTGIALHFVGTTLEVVATDSYRLGVVRIALAAPVTDPGPMPIVPARVARILAKQMKKARGEVRIDSLLRGDERSGLRFSFGDIVISTRTIEGEFPNWRQLLPDPSGAQVRFDSAEMASALKAVDAVRSNGTPVRLSLGEHCSMSLVENGKATVAESLTAATFSPDGVGAIDVAFNPAFLADAIRFLGTERIEMWVRDALKPALLGTPECRYLLMPVRTS